MSQMDIPQVLTALALPTSCLVSHRITKKLLIEKTESTPADKRLIQAEVTEIQWLASLKPNTIGVPSYGDAEREYLEIAVVSVCINRASATSKAAELMQRAIPYPLVLLIQSVGGVTLSFAHKRWAQNEHDKVVLDGEMVSINLPSVHAELFTGLALAKQTQTHLYALYQGWMDTVTNWQMEQLTGRMPQATSDRAALKRIQELDAQIASLRVSASRQRQIAKQVASNLEIQALLAERQKIIGQL